MPVDDLAQPRSCIIMSRKAREPNDKLDRATDKRLAEADRKALHGLCRMPMKQTSEILWRVAGVKPFKTLKVSV